VREGLVFDKIESKKYYKEKVIANYSVDIAIYIGEVFYRRIYGRYEIMIVIVL